MNGRDGITFGQPPYQSSTSMPRPIPCSALLIATTLAAHAHADTAPAAPALPAAAPALPVTQPATPPAQPPSGWLGVRLANRDGAVVASGVLGAGPAARAGLKSGDLITAINGQPVATSEAMIALIRGLPPETAVEVSLGGANPRTVRATLAQRPKNDQEIFRRIVGGTFPSANAVGLDHKPVALPAAHKPTVVYFWATWCPSCSRTAPQLSALQQELGDKVAIIALSPEDPLEVAAYAVKHPDLAYTIATDTDLASLPEVWVAAYPSWLVIDPSGTVVGAHIGAGEVGEVAKELRDLVSQSAK